jgi:NitT/TauT family transport system permease protein
MTAAEPRLHRGRGWIAPVVAVVVWQVLVETGVLAFRFLPAPARVARAVLETVVSGDLAADLLHTAAITVLASLIALALGGVLGLGFGLLPHLRRNAMASVDVLRTIPAVALMPVALLVFGPSPGTELMLAVWAAQWPVLVGTAAGVRNVPDRLYDVAAMLRLSRTATIRKIVVPAVAPSWLAGARLATIVALHVTVTAEMVMAPAGLGGALVQAMQALNVERMWAYAVVCGVVGAAASAGLRRLVAVALPGSPAGRPVSAT